MERDARRQTQRRQERETVDRTPCKSTTVAETTGKLMDFLNNVERRSCEQPKFTHSQVSERAIERTLTTVGRRVTRQCRRESRGKCDIGNTPTHTHTQCLKMINSDKKYQPIVITTRRRRNGRRRTETMGKYCLNRPATRSAVCSLARRCRWAVGAVLRVGGVKGMTDYRTNLKRRRTSTKRGMTGAAVASIDRGSVAGP